MAACYRLVCVSPFHSWGVLQAKSAPTEGKPGSSKSSSSGEHGSVIAQFVGKAEEPKQITVATKGTGVHIHVSL